MLTNNKKRLIFLIVYLAYCSIYVVRVNLSVASSVLIDTNVADAAQIGLLGSAFSIIYSLGRLFNGRLSDRQPPWRMITIGLVVVALSNFCISILPPFPAIFLFWSTNAYAQSMLWSSVLCIVSGLYDARTAKKKTSLMVTSVAAGNVLAIILNTAFISAFGVRYAFIVPGALTLILGCAILLTTRSISAPGGEKKHLSLFGLLKDRETRLMLVPAMAHGVMKENISLWMVLFIIDRFQIDLESSAYFVLFIPVVGLVGRLLYPLCYRLCHEREHQVSVFGFIACLIFSLLLCFAATSPVTAVLYLSLIYTAVSLINTSLLSIYPIRFLKSGNVASVSGLMDFATYLGGGIGSALYGVLILHFGYLPMFLSWAAISLLSLLIFARVRRSV